MTSCVILSCSSVMAAEKDASEAIRSVVATLPNIKKLKPEQEQSLHSFVLAIDVVALLPTGFDIRHEQTLAIGGRSRVTLGRSNSFRLQ